ncbi:F0F1 ATP synthase subunit B family protein [Mycoplasma parvum]|uniref:ATP synthase subunit b n=1 Tax=Mycoplasma parvum str. Indiana TaxID=1403316 RepID=U5NFR9_9MOLU|nr:hypothetical protein [Mycoplasma parvum]AGX89014.1 hypothetical protein PRV_01260 [Mycoplasma parvum str. Indiana]
MKEETLSQKLNGLISFLTTPDPRTIALHFISSLLVIVFIIYYFWKPTDAFIKKQKNKLDRAHIQLATATKETQEALNKLRIQQKRLKLNEQRILEEQREKAKQFLSQKIQEAEAIKSSIIEESKKKVIEIEEEAKKTINDKVIGLSVELTEKLIGASLNRKIHTKVINNYINSINQVFQPKEEKSSEVALN